MRRGFTVRFSASPLSAHSVTMQRRWSTGSKPTVVVIGTGWSGAYFVRDLDPNQCNMTVLSQRNHMVFTPLLPQTCSGTLEFRSVCEPIQRVQPALAKLPNRFFRTLVFGVDFQKQVVNCVGVGVLGAGNDENVPVQSFDVHYDKLVFAHGARPNTFNIPGVEDHAFFLREISEARGIRRRIVQNLMTADLPMTDIEEVKRLLHIVVVGGGPTGVEFAADLADFLHQDIPKIDPALLKYCKVTLVEAGEILGSFDLTLRNYGAKKLTKMGVHLRKAVVAGVTEKAVLLTDGEVLTCGLVVWSTGVGMSTLSKELAVDRNKQGRICVDDELQVLHEGKPVPNVYAVGDCAANVKAPLPTLAAVASRQGTFLAKKMNRLLRGQRDTSLFKFKSLGSMVSLGGKDALIELKQPNSFDITGLKAMYLWKSAYFSMLGSYRSKLYVLVNWCGSKIFGRDITYIAELSETKTWRMLAREEASRSQARLKAMKKLKAGEVAAAIPTVTSETTPASSAPENEVKK
ncbi:NADH dehydrogenase, putative [Bodo saltans]|uniref:NADH dehydrogenase, putative n=1 Tax=Bodo saltans TaxID=75058 RepID=A0A0S4IWQ4_BODSA|nr:NADH dehydrogenase, putative [Bodo saltans]|eukprot:CUG05974.1 NADH dehydrogenase, putative [Bodo saltans]